MTTTIQTWNPVWAVVNEDGTVNVFRATEAEARKIDGVQGPFAGRAELLPFKLEIKGNAKKQWADSLTNKTGRNLDESIDHIAIVEEALLHAAIRSYVLKNRSVVVVREMN